MNSSTATVVFLIGGESTPGWVALFCCRILSQFGHQCHIYFPPELVDENLELYDAVQAVRLLKNVRVIEPENLPIKIDILFCGLFGDNKFKAWYLELQDNLNAVNIKCSLPRDFTSRIPCPIRISSEPYNMIMKISI